MNGTNCTGAAAVTAICGFIASHNIDTTDAPIWIGLTALCAAVFCMEWREARKEGK